MKILVLNSGSSSLKFQLIETSQQQIHDDSDRVLLQGSIEKVGTDQAIVTYGPPGERPRRDSREILEHRGAVQAALDALTNETNGGAAGLEEITGVGHRIVHGGEDFLSSVLITAEVAANIEDSIELAPLHNPHNLKGYHAARELLPGARHVAVFDTSFHHSMPPHAFVYGLPYALYQRHKIRRYGFHGTSHRYVSYRFGRIHGATRKDFKLITCHLGNGCSACAIGHGRVIDTSMGFTPLEGLLMGTRCGDIDPAAVLHVMAKDELRLHEVNSLLNKHSGLYGLSGSSNDMRALLEQEQNGDERARLAIDVFCYRVKKYIGAYYAALNGADAVIFTGGIGENAAPVRARICGGLDALGIQLSEEKNEQAAGEEMEISSLRSKTKVWVIPTNEELLLARDTLRCIEGAALE